MELLLSSYVLYSLSILVIFVGLATLLHLQFGLAGIGNFGIVGFWGIGLYAFSILLLQYNLPFIVALILAAVLSGVVALVLGSIILNLDGEAIIVATLAFATIIEYLLFTERWLTKGVQGYGTIPFPFDLGKYSELGYFLLPLIVLILIILYAYKLKSSSYGRLLVSIHDNETLSQSLGKSTFREKLIFFTITSALIGLFGALSAPIYHYIFPRMVDPGVTFTVWIALIVGGRWRVLGGLVGVIATVGLFDFIIEASLPLPITFAVMVPNIKLIIYGLTLVLVIMFRQSGILGKGKKD